jgi:negative regulator of flagellin synthesis FlgM
MKIESTSNTSLAGLQNGTGVQRASSSDTKAASAVQKVSATGAQQSTVNLSSLASLRPSSSSDIDTAKVESIKAALKDGSYKIDAGKIADGMLGTARDLLQTRTAPTGA